MNNLSSLSISFSDNYKRAFFYLMKMNCVFQELVDFHFLDIFYQLKKYENLFVNFNSLDYFSFGKIIGLIESWKKLKTLKISFFSGDLTYITPSLYKLSLNLEDDKCYKT